MMCSSQQVSRAHCRRSHRTTPLDLGIGGLAKVATKPARDNSTPNVTRVEQENRRIRHHLRSIADMDSCRFVSFVRNVKKFRSLGKRDEVKKSKP